MYALLTILSRPLGRAGLLLREKEKKTGQERKGVPPSHARLTTYIDMYTSLLHICSGCTCILAYYAYAFPHHICVPPCVGRSPSFCVPPSHMCSSICVPPSCMCSPMCRAFPIVLRSPITDALQMGERICDGGTH